MKKLLALALAILMLLSAMTAASAETLTEYPREETMYLFMGMGALPSTLNPLVAGESGWPTGTAHGRTRAAGLRFLYRQR